MGFEARRAVRSNKLRFSVSVLGRFMSKLIRTAATVATVVVGITFAACSGGAGGGGDIATVNDQHISRADFDKRLESSPTAKQVLTQMVQQSLIDQYAKDQKVAVSDADVAKKEADIKSKYPPGQFAAILTQQGLTETDVQNILRQQLVIEKAVGPQVHVSDADIKAYFDKNHATLDKPEQVRARHILVADQKTADMVEAKLKAGGNFADLAKQYSTDPSTKDKGGELGFFGRGQMVPAFQAAAFSLPVGAISAPVKSPFGWHIINVEEKKPATKATLASSTQLIKDQLTQQQTQQQIPVFLQGLRAKANITVNDDRYKDAFPPPLPPPAAGASAPAPASS
jgi:foldase protein PrsA